VYASNIKGYGTKNCLNIKSAITRGGTVENITLENIKMDSVGVVLQVNMNWNPSYSYSELPEEYDYNKIPAHWKKLLEKVDPEQGLPTFKGIKMENIAIKNAETAINVVGLSSSWIEDITLKNVSIQAKNAGRVEYSKNWVIEDLTLKSQTTKAIKKKNTKNIPL